MGNNSNPSIPLVMDRNAQMNSSSMQMKQTPGTSGVSHAMVPSSSHHSVPLNLTLKSVMAQVRQSNNITAQTTNANMQSGDTLACDNSIPGSSNGKHPSLFRKTPNVHILPPTHSSIRNLAFNQGMSKNTHCNNAAFNTNGTLQTNK